MKLLLTFVIVSIVIMLSACSDDCDMENPTVHLVNHGTGKADIQIKTSGGNTENINNIEPGASSPPRSFAPGEVDFTISIQGVDDPIEYTLKIYYCVDYTVTINADNTVSGSAKERD